MYYICGMQNEKLVIMDMHSGDIRGDYKPKQKQRLGRYKKGRIKENTFVLMFLDAMTMGDNLPKHSFPLLAAFMRYMDVKNVFILNSIRRSDICKQLNLSEKSLSTLITRILKNTDLMKRLAPNTYQVNPKYFGMGRISDIQDMQIKFKRISEEEFDTEVVTNESEVTKTE